VISTRANISSGETAAEYVLLWASCALRTLENAALEHAVWEANKRGLPLLAAFALTADYPGANERSFAFLLEGLRCYQQLLKDERGVTLLVLRGSPPAAIAALAARAALVVADVGYTRVSRQWHRQLASECPCSFHAVESEVVVPVELASKREEPAAATLRPKLRRHFQRFLRPLATARPRCGSPALTQLLPLLPEAYPLLPLINDEQPAQDGIAEALTVLGVDRTVPRVEAEVGFRGGSDEAEARLHTFIREKLPRFATFRKDPNARYQSHLSPYLHFGFISPVHAAMEVMEAAAAAKEAAAAAAAAAAAGTAVSAAGGGGSTSASASVEAAVAANPSWPCAPRAESSAVADAATAAEEDGPPSGSTAAAANNDRSKSSSAGLSGAGAGAVSAEDVEAFLDELIVRRELARNLVWYNPQYDNIGCLRSTASWALQTLQEHAFDTRPQLYSFEQLEAGQTEDKYWNAAQHEMVCTGKMHNYMRMYWGKRLLEWSADPGVAYSTAIQLNDKWSLDGRDPNGYMGVAWCFGNHDAATPFGERAIFGTVRSMTPGGLQRKFNIDACVLPSFSTRTICACACVPICVAVPGL
jgi:deoxyribodipyrimidine photolyase